MVVIRNPLDYEGLTCCVLPLEDRIGSPEPFTHLYRDKLPSCLFFASAPGKSVSDIRVLPVPPRSDGRDA